MMRDEMTGALSLDKALGIGTPEQRRGLVELQNQILSMMRAVRDSTGETRAANIAELQTMQEAWAKAFNSIREGSKETVDQLTKDAKKQADASKQAADDSAKAATKAAGGRGAGPINLTGGVDDIASQFRSSITGAMGFIGSAAGNFSEAVSQITDPIERLDMLIKQRQAVLSGMQINAGNFGASGSMLREMDAARAEIQALEGRRSTIRQQQQQEREAALEERNEAYRQRERQKAERDREARREMGLDLAGALTTGKQAGNLTFNLYGATDVREQVDKIESELKRRGVDVSGKRRL